jgi:hypothetical protein
VQCIAGDAVLSGQVDGGLIWIGVVAVASRKGMSALVADIGHREGKSRRNGLLDAEIPGVDGRQQQLSRTRFGRDRVTWVG